MYLLLSSALAAPPPPLFDLGLDLSSGLGGASPGLELSDGPDDGPQVGLFFRGGLGLTAWVSPAVGLGVRVDGGSYALHPGDEGNIFVFAEARYRVDHLVVGAGVGTALMWIEYNCIAGPTSTTPVSCPQSPWETHPPIATVSAAWDASQGAFLLTPGARLEASTTRWAVVADVRVGVRAVRRRSPEGGPELPRP